MGVAFSHALGTPVKRLSLGGGGRASTRVLRLV